MRNIGGITGRAWARPGSQPVYCSSCHHRLLYVPEVGWVDPGRQGTYDMCEADAFANHWPGGAPDAGRD